MNTNSQEWYEQSYKSSGIEAQRKWPNTDAIRFVNKFFDKSNRKQKRILEVGSGTGPNLWMLTEEGFDAFGIDFSETSVNICSQMLNAKGKTAQLAVGDMRHMPYSTETFDGVIDVFSSYAMETKDYVLFLKEIERILKPEGYFYSFTPSVNSDAFKNFFPSTKVDEWTLNGIHRKNSPYYGNFYPFRFTDLDWLNGALSGTKLKIKEIEVITRSQYNSESFEFYSFVLQKE